VDRPTVLSPAACAGKQTGHVVRWYGLGPSQFANIPLRCGTPHGFGLLKILAKHPESVPTLDNDIADTLTNYDHEQRQSPTSVA